MIDRRCAPRPPPPLLAHPRMPSRMRTSTQKLSSSLTRLLLVPYLFDIGGLVGGSKSSWSVATRQRTKRRS